MIKSIVCQEDKNLDDEREIHVEMFMTVSDFRLLVEVLEGYQEKVEGKDLDVNEMVKKFVEMKDKLVNYRKSV